MSSLLFASVSVSWEQMTRILEGCQAYCSTVYLLEECCYDDMGYEVHFHTTYIHVTKRYATCSRCFRTLGVLIWA